MANCGCTDTVPCGTQECGCKFEVDAGCVRYTGDELTCINSSKGDILSDILLNLNEKFCNLIEGNYIEVSQEPIGANCEEGGLKIVVKNINTDAIINTEYLCTVVVNYILPTATSSILGGVKIGSGLTINGSGVLSTTNDYTLPTASPTVLGGIKVGTGLSIDGAGILSSGISGSGINNYVARWTPDGSTLGTGIIRDNGTTIGIGVAPQAGQLVRALTTTEAVAYSINQAFSGSSKGIELVVSNGSGVCIGAQLTVSTNSSINVASLNQAGNNIYNFSTYIPTNSNIGSIVMAQDTNADNNYGLVSIVSLPSLTTNNHIGARFIVNNGVTNYGLQIEDGTEGVGKVLTCMTSDGKANWETTNKQKEITTSNYVLTNADNDYTIFINNGTTAISISLGAITVANFSVGFIQEGSADVTFVGVTNPVGLKLKGQGYQAFIERKLATSTYYLLGNTKA